MIEKTSWKGYLYGALAGAALLSAVDPGARRWHVDTFFLIQDYVTAGLRGLLWIPDPVSGEMRPALCAKCPCGSDSSPSESSSLESSSSSSLESSSSSLESSSSSLESPSASSEESSSEPSSESSEEGFPGAGWYCVELWGSEPVPDCFSEYELIFRSRTCSLVQSEESWKKWGVVECLPSGGQFVFRLILSDGVRHDTEAECQEDCDEIE